MTRIVAMLACALLFFSVGTAAQWGSGWAIAAGADNETNPVKSDAASLKTGKSLYDANCSRCHGPQGKGDGKESDKDNPAADLTDSFRADLNPDGVIFYRVVGGKPPVMPAFKDKLTPQQTW